jgi:hypothetical protein
MSTPPPPPPYTRTFLIQYRQQYVKQQEALALTNFVNNVTNAVLAAAKQGLSSYTVREIPVSSQFQQAMNALKVNFPDITIRLINIPTNQKLVSQPAILINWA